MKKTRALLIVSGILSFALAAGLIFAFVFLSFEGIVNNFSNLGVLCNFPEVVGVIGLACLLFGLMCIKLGVSQFRQSRTESYVYKRGRFKLVCAIFVYLSLCVVGAFLIFETYADISAVGQAFLSCNFGYFGIGILAVSFFALMSVSIDLFAFNHDVKNGLITPEEDKKMLMLPAPKYKLVYKGSEKTIDFASLQTRLARLGQLRDKDIISADDYRELRQELIDQLFK